MRITHWMVIQDSRSPYCLIRTLSEICARYQDVGDAKVTAGGLERCYTDCSFLFKRRMWLEVETSVSHIPSVMDKSCAVNQDMVEQLDVCESQTQFLIRCAANYLRTCRTLVCDLRFQTIHNFGVARTKLSNESVPRKHTVFWWTFPLFLQPKFCTLFVN